MIMLSKSQCFQWFKIHNLMQLGRSYYLFALLLIDFLSEKKKPLIINVPLKNTIRKYSNF